MLRDLIRYLRIPIAIIVVGACLNVVRGSENTVPLSPRQTSVEDILWGCENPKDGDITSCNLLATNTPTFSFSNKFLFKKEAEAYIDSLTVEKTKDGSLIVRDENGNIITPLDGGDCAGTGPLDPGVGFDCFVGCLGNCGGDNIAAIGFYVRGNFGWCYCYCSGMGGFYHLFLSVCEF